MNNRFNRINGGPDSDNTDCRDGFTTIPARVRNFENDISEYAHYISENGLYDIGKAPFTFSINERNIQSHSMGERHFSTTSYKNDSDIPKILYKYIRINRELDISDINVGNSIFIKQSPEILIPQGWYSINKIFYGVNIYAQEDYANNYDFNKKYKNDISFYVDLNINNNTIIFGKIILSKRNFFPERNRTNDFISEDKNTYYANLNYILLLELIDEKGNLHNFELNDKNIHLVEI